MFLSGEFGQRVLALNHSATSKEHGTKRPDDEATFQRHFLLFQNRVCFSDRAALSPRPHSHSGEWSRELIKAVLSITSVMICMPYIFRNSDSLLPRLASGSLRSWPQPLHVLLCEAIGSAAQFTSLLYSTNYSPNIPSFHAYKIHSYIHTHTYV